MLSSPTRLTRSVKASIERSGASHGGKTPAGMTRPVTKFNTKIPKRKVSVTSSENSDEDVEQEDEADEEDNDDSVDESDDEAPSYHSRNVRKAGRPSNVKGPRVEEMFTDEENAFLSDSDNDDEIYGAVDDISDDEDLADADLEGVEEQALADEFDLVGEALAADFLGEIDGLSAYGFGEELDVADFSSSTDSSEDAAAERRVHFENAVDHVASRDMTSPILEMKPLRHPPAFSQEELQAHPHAGEISADHRAFFGDPDEDSDLTDDDLPAEAHTAPSALQQHPLPIFESSEPTSPSNKRNKKAPPRRRGPVRGIFKIDEDKCWAVLDPSGKKINVCPAPATGRHEWLEKKAAEALGLVNSATSSPQNSFATLLDEDDRSITSSQDGLETMISGSGANLMVAGLNGSGTPSNQYGYAIGPPEAFYAPAGAQVMGDYLIDPADFDQDEDDILDPTGEGRIQLEELIAFDEDSSDEEIDSTPAYTSTEVAVTPISKRSSDNYSHLNSDNIMSFRRGADLSSAHHQSWDFEPRPSPTSYKFPSTPITRKRKARSPPYRGSHYEGTTPIRREIITPKRRRTNTIG